jgi:hypothetical protein
MGFHSLLWLAALVTSALAIAIGPANTTSGVVFTLVLTAITVPKCAVIVKLVNSTRHEFQIVPVECPAPGDYWLVTPQTVFFESSDLIEVTHQKDVFVGTWSNSSSPPRSLLLPAASPEV